MKICEAGRDPCGCNNWSKGIRTINGQYPDDNREFGIVEGTGILITPTTAGIKITNTTNPGALEAGQNIVLTPSGDKLIIGTTDDIRVNGDLNVDGDIFQQGASYETHMEQVYTTDDYITMRDGAVTGLSSGQYSGFQVKKYDGTNDGRLVIDGSGIARVGDVGDEQPLLTREEAANLNNGALLKWDATNQKAVDEGTIGSDTKPIKIVNGVATPVTNDLVSTSGDQNIIGSKTLVGSLYLAPSLADILGRIFAFTDSNGKRIIQRVDNSVSNIRLQFELRNDDNGTVSLVMQKRQLSPDALLGSTVIATL